MTRDIELSHQTIANYLMAGNQINDELLIEILVNFYMLQFYNGNTIL